MDSPHASMKWAPGSYRRRMLSFSFLCLQSNTGILVRQSLKVKYLPFFLRKIHFSFKVHLRCGHSAINLETLSLSTFMDTLPRAVSLSSLYHFSDSALLSLNCVQDIYSGHFTGFHLESAVKVYSTSFPDAWMSLWLFLRSEYIFCFFYESHNFMYFMQSISSDPLLTFYKKEPGIRG